MSVEDDVAPLWQALADLLAGLREGAVLTQQDLADRLGYARVTVSCAETGHRLPAEGFWLRADDVLGAAGELARAYEQLAAARVERRRRLVQAADAERRARAGRQRVSASPPGTGRASLELIGGATGRDGPGRRVTAGPWPAMTDGGPLSSAALRRPVGDGGGRADTGVLTVAGGRSFSGSSLEVLTCDGVEEEGRILAALPPTLADSAILRRPTRGMLVCLLPGPTGPACYGLDSRAARRRLAWAAGDRFVLPRAYALDELTLGLIWAAANLDESLLGDDALLADHRRRLLRYESFRRSAAGRDDADGLSAVSRMWLGSDFCARHILRCAERLTDTPAFWTREQRGEEASSWLLFAHKYEYLRRLADAFGRGVGLSRAFCIPADMVGSSPRFERVLVLLAAALMESFSVRVEVCGDPEYAGVEGFVLDHSRQAIVANWVGADGIWHVDLTDQPPVLREYADVSGYARSHSVVAGPTPADRLHALADYLDIDWGWLTRRCGELAEYGFAGLAEPRSRLLSPAGVDQACRYLSQIGRTAAS